jgi:hypothetical protein
VADGLDYYGIRHWPYLWKRWINPVDEMGMRPIGLLILVAGRADLIDLS